MNRLPRFEATLLQRGTVIDLDDLGRDEAVTEHFRFAFDSHFRQYPNTSPYLIVDHLIRNGPDNYEIVPFLPKEGTHEGIFLEDELRELGLLVDTRHVTKIKGYSELYYQAQGEPDPHVPVIIDRVYERDATLAGGGSWLLSGEQLAKEYVEVPGSPKLRPKHRYTSMNLAGTFVMDYLIRHYDRRWLHFNLHHITQTLIDSKTIHYFAKPVLLARREQKKDYEQPVPFVFLDVNVKRFKRWMARNHSRFFQGAAEAQAIEDQFDLEAQEQEAAERLKNLESEAVPEPQSEESMDAEMEAEEPLDGFDRLFGPASEEGAEPEPFLPIPEEKLNLDD